MHQTVIVCFSWRFFASSDELMSLSFFSDFLMIEVFLLGKTVGRFNRRVFDKTVYLSLIGFIPKKQHQFSIVLIQELPCEVAHNFVSLSLKAVTLCYWQFMRAVWNIMSNSQLLFFLQNVALVFSQLFSNEKFLKNLQRHSLNTLILPLIFFEFGHFVVSWCKKINNCAESVYGTLFYGGETIFFCSMLIENFIKIVSHLFLSKFYKMQEYCILSKLLIIF